MSKDFLIDGVTEFMRSDTWKNEIEAFLQDHCSLFVDDFSPERSDMLAKGNGYSIQQFDAFTAYRDIVERMLENVVQELGCRPDDLLSLLDARTNYNGDTSRNKHLLQMLLTYDDYEAFRDKISQFTASRQASLSPGSSEISEWELQEVIARSILDAQSRGELEEEEESWVPWAEAMVQMCDQSVCLESPAVDSSLDTRLDMNDVTPVDDELRHNLIKERLKVDLLVAQRIADANVTLKHHLLDLESSEGLDEVDSEENLVSLFAQLDTLQDRVTSVKQKCFAFENVSRDQLDCLYLFLKEKVHYGEDLVVKEKEIGKYIFCQIDADDAPIVPLILEWLLLESEILRVQTRLRSHFDGDREAIHDDVYWVQHWDEASQSYYYVCSSTNESVWEAPSVGYYDINQEYQWPVSQYESYDTTCEENNSTWTEYKAEDDNLGWAECKDGENGHRAESKLPDNEKEESNTSVTEKTFDEFSAAIEGLVDISLVQFHGLENELKRISKEHEEERGRLELVLELEKARRKEDLRNRKEKRRKEKLEKRRRKSSKSRDVKDITASDDIKYDAKKDSYSEVQTTDLSALMPPAETKLSSGKLPSLETASEKKSNAYLRKLLLEGNLLRKVDEKQPADLPEPPPEILLNPVSRRYLTGLAMKRLKNMSRESNDIVLEEPDAK